MKCSIPIALTGLFFSVVYAQYSTLEVNVRDNHLKNIAFVATLGGASHYNWVLSIIDELGMRGHNTTLVTSNEDTRFGQPYSHVKTVSLGPRVEINQSYITGSKTLRTINLPKFFSITMDTCNQNFEHEYQFLLDYFANNNIDLAICDHVSESCFAAATKLDLPYIVTAALEVFSESTPPYINNKFTSFYDYTTEHQSFSKRFHDKFLLPLEEFYYFYPKVKSLNKRRAAVGLGGLNLDPHHRDSLKLINNLHGFSAPRPVDPLIELVGPIMPKQYKPLTPELQDYLDQHQRVAYVAFGQMATPNEQEISLLLTALLENIENGSLDGLVWATVNAAGFFPDTITTSSGTTYQVHDFFDGRHPDIRIINWAPQTAVLMHPSTTVFVSHGGLGSWYESMYSGTRMVMFPFFGDQPANSLIIERGNLGGIIDYDFTPEEAAALIKKIADDKDGEIQKNVKRYQALVQIHSGHGIIRAADLVEEVAYTNVNGKLPHRETADRRMSYIKSHNIDLYLAFVMLVTASLFVCSFLVKHLFLYSSISPIQKVKKA